MQAWDQVRNGPLLWFDGPDHDQPQGQRGIGQRQDHGKAVRAGYSAKTANEQGARLLANVSVRSAIEDAMKARESRTEITQDRVLQELARIAFFDLRKLYREDGSLKAMHELDDDAAAVLSGGAYGEDQREPQDCHKVGRVGYWPKTAT